MQMRQVFQLPVASATLPTSQALEQTLLSRNPGYVSPGQQQLCLTVRNSHGAGPTRHRPVRDMVDMTDARLRQR